MRKDSVYGITKKIILMFVSWISFSLNIFTLKLVCYTSIPFLHASLFHIISWEKLTSEMIFSLRKRKPNTKYPLQKKGIRILFSLSFYILSFLTSLFLPLKNRRWKNRDTASVWSWTNSEWPTWYHTRPR